MKNKAADYFKSGFAHFCQDQFELAIKDFSKVIKLDPDLVKAYHYRSGAYFANGQYELAIQDMSKAFKLDPELTKSFLIEVEKQARKHKPPHRARKPRAK
jgi:tetratricopeptide (TPR) repeat protein